MAVAAAVERFGGIDIVVVNAGVGAYGPFLELPAEHLDEMIDVNVGPSTRSAPPCRTC
jgi:NAD(P)-dependent dehydrogenase (short-subunit alcohol dehydrogenase family)